MQLSGRGSQEQRSTGASFGPLQVMTNDGKSSWPCNSSFSGRWASSWPRNGDFGGPWTSRWLSNGDFGSSWTSSWPGFGAKAGHREQLWTPSWRWNDDFGSPWTPSWLWNGCFGHPWKSSWPWNNNFANFELFSYDFWQFRKACEPSEVPCLSAKTEVQPFVL